MTDLVEANANAVDKVLTSAIKATEPKFDTIICVPILFAEGGRWYSVDLNFNEYLQVLRTGEIDGKQICAIEVSTTNADNEDDDKIRMIYDFRLLHLTQNPWRMV